MACGPFHADMPPRYVVAQNAAIEIIGAALISRPVEQHKLMLSTAFATGRSVMISKTTIAALALVTMSLASPTFAQTPGYYYDYAPGNAYGYAPGYVGPYAYSYQQPGPFAWYYGYGGGWPPGSAASVLYNIHTPPNH